MKKHLFILVFLLIIESASSQNPKADFDFTVEYQCGLAKVGVINKSVNADLLLWDLHGTGNYQSINNPNPPLGNSTTEHSYKVSLIAQKQTLADTITKTFNLRLTRASFDYKVQDKLQMAPLSVEFINNSTPANGDVLLYKWDFGDGSTSTLMNPTHVYSSPKTYSSQLTAITEKGCVLHSNKEIIVKDTAQRNEFDFIISGCHESDSPCGYDKHFVIQNDTLKMYGYYGGNCCTRKTAALRRNGDTIFVRTFQTGPLCTCGCNYCFSINVPNIHKDSLMVSFDGIFANAKLQTSTVNDLKDYSFEIYPNPVVNEFTLFCNKLTSKSSISIQDLFGRIVYSKTGMLSNRTVIQCDNIKSGVYILKVNLDGKKSFAKKILLFR